MTTTWTKVSNNNASWTAIPKPLPTTSVITQVATGGDPIGLLLALTYTRYVATSIVTGIWTPINSNSTAWVGVAKAT